MNRQGIAVWMGSLPWSHRGGPIARVCAVPSLSKSPAAKLAAMPLRHGPILATAQRVMDLKQLEYFVSVVDLGGFSRAARALGVAQPAISRQVRSLEVELRQIAAARATAAAPCPPRPASACSSTHAASCSRSSVRAATSTRPRARRWARSSSACRRPSPGSSPCRSCARSGSATRGASLSIVEGFSSTIRRVAGGGPRRRRARLQPGPGRRRFEVRVLLEEPLCLIGPRTDARLARRLRLADLPRFPLIIPSQPNAIRRWSRPASRASACARRWRWRSTRYPRSSNSSPRATASPCCPRARCRARRRPRACTPRTIVAPQLKQRAGDRHLGPTALDAAAEGGDRNDRGARRTGAGPRLTGARNRDRGTAAVPRRC